jgi:hypothetical protein
LLRLPPAPAAAAVAGAVARCLEELLARLAVVVAVQPVRVRRVGVEFVLGLGLGVEVVAVQPVPLGSGHGREGRSWYGLSSAGRPAARRASTVSKAAPTRTRRHPSADGIGIGIGYRPRTPETDDWSSDAPIRPATRGPRALGAADR